jgi:hypothetical protein
MGMSLYFCLVFVPWRPQGIFSPYVRIVAVAVSVWVNIPRQMDNVFFTQLNIGCKVFIVFKFYNVSNETCCEFL